MNRIEDPAPPTGISPTATSSAVVERRDWMVRHTRHHALLVPGATRVQPQVLSAFDVDHPFQNQVRSVRNALMTGWLRDQDQAGASLAIVSPGRQEGRSVLAANLGVAFSQAGLRTLLIDASEAAPTQHLLFGLDGRGPGLAEVLAGNVDPVSAPATAGIEGLAILRAGEPEGSGADLLSSPVVASLLLWYRHRFDLILIDTDDATSNPNALLVAAAAGSALLALRKGRSARRDAKELVSRIRASRSTVVGSVAMQW